MAELQAQLRNMLKPFDALRDIRPGSTESLDQLQKALLHLPAGADFGAEIDVFYKHAQSVLTQARQERREAFRRIEADFIRDLRSSGQHVREQGGHAWRVGPVAIELEDSQARARVLYNREPLTSWGQIGTLRDLQGIHKRALQDLATVEIPEATLGEVFERAYRELVARKTVSAAGTRVHIRELYPETRLSLARLELERKPDSTIKHAKFPLWAFLYNLDRYRKLSGSMGRDGQLKLLTGSQRETEQGLVVNGLDPVHEYQKVCFVSN